MSTLPRCTETPELWDSTDPTDHHEAATICAICPLLSACHDRLLETQASVGRSMTAAGGGPVGTWAGVLVGKTGARRAQCGTDSGYFRHRRYDEDPCGDCYEAHSRAESARYVRRRMRAAS